MIKETAKHSARETALNILYQVSEKAAYANIELNRTLTKSSLSHQDKALVTELVYGTVRMQGSIDYILSIFVKKSLGTLSAWILLILRMAVYQMIYMDKIPDRAAVNEAVNMAKKYGHPGTVKFVNGVLRNISRSRDEIKFPLLEEDAAAHISAVFSHPRWLVEKWIGQMGIEETISLCQMDNEAAPVTVRTNTLKVSREILLKRLEEEGARCLPGRYAPEGIILEGMPAISSMPSFQEGLFQVQDEGSMLAAHALGASPGSCVIDACAAPGGKTTHIAQLMENRGEIKAFDIYEHKLALVKENCRRLGITVVETLAGDSRSLPSSLYGWADFVLVDAPCSGLGVLRRRPDARWQKSEENIRELVPVQKEILASAGCTVKAGGVLLYSTCTISPEENEQVIKWFLENYPDFYLGPIEFLLNVFKKEEEKEQARRGMISLLPHVYGTDGMFMARLCRKERRK